MTIKAIQTEYRGILFRSRLEARWAMFFDSLRIKWLYEHEGYQLGSDRYLPDFYLPNLKCFVEVKGQKPNEREQRVAFELSKEKGLPVHIFAGAVPRPKFELWMEDGFETYTFDYSKQSENMRGQLYLKDIYALNQCPRCERYGFSRKGITGLLDCGCGIGPRTNRFSESIQAAYRKARMARFE